VKDIFKTSIAVFLLWVFILPIGVKALHFHHHEVTWDTQTGRHFHPQSDKCEICDFSNSVFSPVEQDDHLSEIIFFDSYINLFSSTFISTPQRFSYLLRAPPSGNDLF
jgi:hypothetical protein